MAEPNMVSSTLARGGFLLHNELAPRRKGRQDKQYSWSSKLRNRHKAFGRKRPVEEY